jgi:hypothetical protein
MIALYIRHHFNQNDYNTDTTARHFVVKKNNKVVGYLRGSLHAPYSWTAMKSDRADLQNIYSKADVSYIFHEVASDALAALYKGTEGISYRLSALYKKQIQSLETPAIQTAILLLPFPSEYGFYTLPLSELAVKRPELTTYIAFFLKFLSYSYCYFNNVSTPSAQLELFKEISENFNNGLVSDKYIDKYNHYSMLQRDKAMYDNLKRHIPSFSEDHKFLIIIGAAHLCLSKGLRSHFLQDGYTVEEDAAYWHSCLKTSKILEKTNRLILNADFKLKPAPLLRKPFILSERVVSNPTKKFAVLNITS